MRIIIERVFRREGFEIPASDALDFITRVFKSRRLNLYRRFRLAPVGYMPFRHAPLAPPVVVADPPRPEVTTPTWFELLAVDEFGEPMASVPFHVLVESKTTPFKTDAGGRIRVDSPAGSRFSSARVVEVHGVWETLTQREQQEREGPPLEHADGRTFLPIVDPSAIPQTRLQLTKNTRHLVVFRRQTATLRILVGAPDPDSAVEGERPEVYALRSTDGIYEHVVELRNAGRTSDHHYLVEFPDVTAGRNYNLECDFHGDGEFDVALFEDVPFASLEMRCKEGDHIHELENQAPAHDESTEEADHPDAIARVPLEHVA